MFTNVHAAQSYVYKPGFVPLTLYSYGLCSGSPATLVRGPAHYPRTSALEAAMACAYSAQPMPARELPPPDTLSERQLRGADCCFCGSDLTRAGAIDLGQRRMTVYGSRVSWFPRCCPACPGGAS